MGLQFQSIAPIAPLVAADLELRYAQIGLLVGVFMLPGALLSLPGGLLGDRFGDRRVMLVELALLSGGGLIVAGSRAFAVALAGRLLSGSGGVLLNLHITKAVTAWFAGARIATAMGLTLAMFPLGVALALAALGTVAVATSWRIAVASTAVYGALAFALLALLYREPQEAPRERAPLWTITPREIGLVVPLALAWTAVNAGFIVYVAFAPTFLVERGFSLAAAGFLVSWASWLTIATLPLGGLVVDRAPRASVWIAGGTIAAAATCVALTVGGPPLMWIALNEVVSSPMVAIVGLAGTALHPSSRGTGLGIFYAIAYLGMVGVPPLAGWLVDVTGSAAPALWLAAAVWLSIVPSMVAVARLRQAWAPTLVAD